MEGTMTMEGQMEAKIIRALSPTNLNSEELNKLESDLRKRLTRKPWQQRTLEWLRDYVNPEIPSLWRKLVLGHDFTLSVSSELALRFKPHDSRHFEHPYKRGLWLPSGAQAVVVSNKKVTVAFRDFIVDQLQTETSAFGDFKHHEIGTDGTAEANSQTALVATSGIARAVGTQAENAANIYESVATTTADTGETWQEHGIFNAAAAGTMMDRSVINPGIAVVASDTLETTYRITFNAEA